MEPSASCEGGHGIQKLGLGQQQRRWGEVLGERVWEARSMVEILGQMAMIAAEVDWFSLEVWEPASRDNVEISRAELLHAWPDECLFVVASFWS